MIRSGRNNPPRLIFDGNEKYLLNTPQRYCCKGCANTHKEEKKLEVPPKQRTQYTWLTTDDS
jgi:hypothetical protein